MSTITNYYDCAECGAKEKLVFTASQECAYADDCMVELGWHQDASGIWYCPECTGEGCTDAA